MSWEALQHKLGSLSFIRYQVQQDHLETALKLKDKEGDLTR